MHGSILSSLERSVTIRWFFLLHNFYCHCPDWFCQVPLTNLDRFWGYICFDGRYFFSLEVQQKKTKIVIKQVFHNSFYFLSTPAQIKVTSVRSFFISPLGGVNSHRPGKIWNKKGIHNTCFRGAGGFEIYLCIPHCNFKAWWLWGIYWAQICLSSP